MPYNQEIRRGTGRTTRMLECALAIAASGRKVVIVVLTRAFVSGYETIARHRNIEYITDHGLDWDTLQPADCGENTIVLFDHSVLEIHFEQMLTKLHQFDRFSERIVVEEYAR